MHTACWGSCASNLTSSWFVFRNQLETKGAHAMKSLLWYAGALSATAAFLLIRSVRLRNHPPVVELAHKLEAAWADHHTVA